MNKKYDVIIIGAGPAGISAALNLQKLGKKNILVIERYAFPRYKCCAGYITGKTKKEYARLGLDTDKVNYSLIRDFGIFYRSRKRQDIQNKFLYTNRYIDRVELDDAFFRLAKEKGGEIKENTAIKNHDADSCLLVTSDDESLAYDKLIFADGASGYGSRYKIDGLKNIAMQLVFDSDRQEEIQIHFGITRRGYGWISSFGGKTNVGLTDVYDPAVNYTEEFQRFLDILGIEADTGRLRGAFTPIGVSDPILGEKIYYVGDAVGACDPLTLSGLRYALRSAEECARAIALGRDEIYIEYIKKLKRRFAFMRAMQKIFYLRFCMYCVFNIGCRFFGRLVAAVFNNFFVNKK